MDKLTIHISANEQILTSAECPLKVASNTVSYIEAVFDLGENWTGYDSVRAVWSTYLETIATVLDNEGKCVVPHEVLTRTGKVSVNLVGSIVEDNELTDRLTTYPTVVLNVNADAYVEGTETAPITPSQFEQFVAEVSEEVAQIKDIVSTTLNDDYTLTFVFSDGTETTVGPIRGEQGEQGIQGIQGPPGPPGEVTMAQFESAFPTDTASGAIASFPDGSDLFGAKSLVAEINPIQDLHGYDSPWVGGAGKNKFDRTNVVDGYVSASGHISSASSVFLEVTSDYISVTPSTAYIFSAKVNNSEQKWVGIGLYDADKTFITRIGGNKDNDIIFSQALSATDMNGVYYVRVSYRTYGIDTDAQFEQGSTATSYAPYSNICPISGWDSVGVTVEDDIDNPTEVETYTATLPTTTYGGSVDLVSGKLLTCPYYASYNGETLTGEWISDRDKYVAGTTPTTGAQVVNIGGTKTESTITATDVQILKATNNIFADSGNVSVTYKADTQLWVEKKLSE